MNIKYNGTANLSKGTPASYYHCDCYVRARELHGSVEWERSRLVVLVVETAIRLRERSVRYLPPTTTHNSYCPYLSLSLALVLSLSILRQGYVERATATDCPRTLESLPVSFVGQPSDWKRLARIDDWPWIARRPTLLLGNTFVRTLHITTYLSTGFDSRYFISTVILNMIICHIKTSNISCFVSHWHYY